MSKVRNSEFFQKVEQRLLISWRKMEKLYTLNLHGISFCFFKYLNFVFLKFLTVYNAENFHFYTVKPVFQTFFVSIAYFGNRSVNHLRKIFLVKNYHRVIHLCAKMKFSIFMTKLKIFSYFTTLDTPTLVNSEFWEKIISQCR